MSGTVVLVPLNRVPFFQEPANDSQRVLATAGKLVSILVGLSSQFWARRYKPRWFRKYNYVLSAAFDGGAQIMILFLSMVFQGGDGKKVTFPTPVDVSARPQLSKQVAIHIEQKVTHKNLPQYGNVTINICLISPLTMPPHPSIPCFSFFFWLVDLSHFLLTLHAAQAIEGPLRTADAHTGHFPGFTIDGTESIGRHAIKLLDYSFLSGPIQLTGDSC
ncbi:hypothetical protein VP01_409g1 [Puccinia sorghi]|uniref:Uncharacterized protein n=1 Tax=Puccinia sorghi TaxID=27349 RepID=A0A0L6URE0_9BASI|nr:hypothetical protein VP01_409g1 [Puccinia sorghi]